MVTKLVELEPLVNHELDHALHRAHARALEVKAAQLTQMILNSKTGAIEPLLKEIEKPVITTPASEGR